MGLRSGVQLLVLGLLRGTGSGLRASVLVTEQTGWEDNNVLSLKGLPLCLWGFPPHLLGSQCPPLEERYLSMPETGEKERNYLFKSYTVLLSPSAQSGVLYLRKRSRSL